MRGDINVASGPPADRPAQLHRRAERHRHAVHHVLQDARITTTATSARPTRRSRSSTRRSATVSTSCASPTRACAIIARARSAGAVPADHASTLATGVSRAVAGPSSSRRKNELDQDIVELNDAFTLMKGKHTLTLGTHNEFLDLSNLFIRDNFGTYPSPASTTSSRAWRRATTTASRRPAIPTQPAAFKVRQLGFYAGDSWRTRPNMTLTYGIRVDAPQLPDKPQRESGGGRQLRLRDRRRPEPRPVLAARRRQLRPERQGHQRRSAAGIGLFTGRPSYVWLSNQYGNTGIDFTRIGAASNNANNRFRSSPIALNQPTTVTGATAGSFSNEIDMIDPELQVPRGPARQRRLRPPRCPAGSTAPPTSSGRRRSRTSSTRTSTSCRCRARPASAAGRCSRARSRR